ncbi:MAG TPA: HYR domain-containing protein [Saprospiraceae bacterium]|nr:HYR domain-containing protein [Saprospiraceae bacterium]
MKRFNTPQYKGFFVSLLILWFSSLAYAQETQIANSNQRPNCDRPPIISCPQDQTLCPGAATTTDVMECATARPGSITCRAPIVEYIDRILNSGNCGQQTIQRIWTAKDPDDDNLRAFCIQYITLQDTTAPAFLYCPKDTILKSNDKCVAFYKWQSPWVTDDCGKFTVTSTHVNGTKFNIGVTNVIITATDECGNSSSCSFNVTVTNDCCTKPPVISCPANAQVCPADNIDPTVTGMATATKGNPLCSDPTISFTDQTIYQSACSTKIERTWLAQDPNFANLKAECVQTIYKIDALEPTIVNCPANVTVDPGSNCKAKVDWLSPTVTDNCGTVTLSSSHTSGSEFSIGTTRVEITATDACNNSTSCSFTITVTNNCCTKPPVISCPANAQVCPADNIDPTVTGMATATKGNPLCSDPTISFTDQTIYQSACSTKIERTWLAQDPNFANLKAECVQTIYKIDALEPTIVNCPANVTVDPGSNCKAKVDWLSPTVTDNCGTVTLSSSHTSGSEFGIGTTTVIVTATDACNNSTTCNFTITVNDNCCNKPPVITCPANAQVCPADPIEPANTGTATAVGGHPSCSTPTITYVDQAIFTSPCSTVIDRVWTATDPNNASLTASCTQRIYKLDADGPVFTSCPVNFTVDPGPNCEATVNWAEPTATDNCSNPTIHSNYVPNTIFGIGNTLVVYTATDACGHTSSCWFTITVNDNCCNKPPVITCPANAQVCPADPIEPANTGTATAVGGHPSCGTPIITYVDQTVYASACSTVIDRVWTATDPNNASLTVTCTQRIYKLDADGPVFTSCPVNFTVDPGPNCETTVNWAEPTARDNCSNPTIHSNYVPNTIFGIGNTLVVYTATDACGHTSSCWFTVTVNDNCCNKPPVITCPANAQVCPADPIEPANTGTATAVGGHPSCGTPTITYVDQTVYASACSTVIDRIWTATDPNNTSLTATCTQRIYKLDADGPRIENCPANITVDPNPNCKVTVNWVTPTASDNCGVVNLSSTHNSGSEFGIGTTEITYTATDACGYSSSCSFTVTVNDNCCNKPPVITCPANAQVCPTDPIEPANTGTATAVGGHPSCGTPIITYVDQAIFTSTCSTVIDRIWTATDPNNASLIATCTQRIYKLDADGPRIENCPANITVDPNPNCKVTVNWTTPTATDNCGVVNLSSTHNSGSEFGIGTTEITYTATDACGYSSSCSFTVTVNDNCCNKPPVITCPANAQVCPTDPIEPANTGTATAVGGHPSCGTPNITYVDQAIFTSTCSTVIDRVWTATDPNNASLTATCTQRIYKVDLDGPVFTDCPVNFTVDPSYDCEAIVNWTPPTVSDVCSTPTVNSNYLPNTSLPFGNTLVVYTATDACGNTSSCWFTITVTENCCDRDPILLCPSDYFSCPNSSIDPSITGQATASPGRPGCKTPVVSYRDSSLSVGPCVGAKKFIRIWTAVDPMLPNLKSTCMQTIELKDTQAPIFSNVPRDTVLDAHGRCSIAYHWTPPAVIDSCGLKSVVSTHNPGHSFNGGITVVKYTATDHCGNISTVSFTVKVIGYEVEIICPNDTMVSRVDPYLGGIAVNWNLPKVNYCNPCVDSIPGFIYMGEYAGHRYFCSRAPATWDEARLICSLNGGYLASMGSAAENAYVSSKLMGLTAWIGGHDENFEGRFEWVNGEPFAYHNWLLGQPNNGFGIEDYIELRPDGFWNDQAQGISNEFVCEIPCYELKQISGPTRGTTIPCGTHEIKYEATVGYAKDTCSFNVQIKCDSISKYCLSRGNDSRIAWIDSVKFNTIQNRSGNNGGYAFFNTSCDTVYSGNSYQLLLKPGFLGTVYQMYWKVWIDYNGDGVFNNSIEQVLYGYGNTSLVGDIKIPDGLTPLLTRMRISMAYGAYPAGPCSSFLYGEVEDYCISINGGTSFGSQEKNSSLIKDQVPGILKCLGECTEKTEQLNSKLSDLGDVQLFDAIVYPNPAHQAIGVEATLGKILEVFVFDSNGKMNWRSGSVQQSNQIQIATEDWKAGVYNAVIQGTNGERVVKRFSVYH